MASPSWSERQFQAYGAVESFEGSATWGAALEWVRPLVSIQLNIVHADCHHFPIYQKRLSQPYLEMLGLKPVTFCMQSWCLTTEKQLYPTQEKCPCPLLLFSILQFCILHSDTVVQFLAHPVSKGVLRGRLITMYTGVTEAARWWLLHDYQGSEWNWKLGSPTKPSIASDWVTYSKKIH